MLCVSQRQWGNYSKWPPTAIPLWYGNIQHSCLRQFLIVMIFLAKFKNANHAIKIGIDCF